MNPRLILVALLTCATLLSGALAQDKGSVNPKPLPPLANPNDPKLAAKELFGRKLLPAAMKPQVYGFYTKGCLAGAEGLPISGDTWQVMRLSRNRNWAHPDMVALLKRLSVRAHKDAGWPGILVGDMGQPRGGPTFTGHTSHQIGLDADIWLTPMPDHLLSREEREETSAVMMVREDRLDIDPKVFTAGHVAVIRDAAQEPVVQRDGHGEAVDGVFACTRKERLAARTGAPYLSIELRDRSGALPARVFRDADLQGGRFDAGELVRVRGRVVRFREQTQIELDRIERASGEDVDPAAFLPVAYRDLDELDGFLEHLAREVYDRRYRELLDGLLADDSLRRAWRLAPCTRAGHHAYLGGLLEHTVAVATLAHELCQLHPRLNSDLLLTAALTHDLGRTREFTYGAEIGLTEEGRLLGHLTLGQLILSESSRGLDEERRLALLHCVLCHHGTSSAPGGRFASAEALALYRLNALDASVKGAFEHGLPH